jgi:hypothetical protein
VFADDDGVLARSPSRAVEPPPAPEGKAAKSPLAAVAADASVVPASPDAVARRREALLLEAGTFVEGTPPEDDFGAASAAAAAVAQPKSQDLDTTEVVLTETQPADNQPARAASAASAAAAPLHPASSAAPARFLSGSSKRSRSQSAAAPAESKASSGKEDFAAAGAGSGSGAASSSRSLSRGTKRKADSPAGVEPPAGVQPSVDADGDEAMPAAPAGKDAAAAASDAPVREPVRKRARRLDPEISPASAAAKAEPVRSPAASTPQAARSSRRTSANAGASSASSASGGQRGDAPAPEESKPLPSPEVRGSIARGGFSVLSRQHSCVMLATEPQRGRKLSYAAAEQPSASPQRRSSRPKVPLVVSLNKRVPSPLL